MVVAVGVGVGPVGEAVGDEVAVSGYKGLIGAKLDFCPSFLTFYPVLHKKQIY
jgi:hypothetical protein